MNAMDIAEREFVIDGSQQRVWELLLKAALRFVPLERMKPINERCIEALLRVKIGLFSFPVNVRIEIAEVVPPEILVTVFKATGIRGFIRLDQRSTFTLVPKGEDKTQVQCKIAEEGMSTLLRLFLLWWVRRFARATFDNL